MDQGNEPFQGTYALPETQAQLIVYISISPLLRILRM